MTETILAETQEMEQEREFTTFPPAFDYCREKGHPVRVRVNGERWKLFPSGSAVELAKPKAHVPRIVALRTSGTRHWMEVTREGRLPNREIDLALGEWMKVRDALGYRLSWRHGSHQVWRPDNHA